MRLLRSGLIIWFGQDWNIYQYLYKAPLLVRFRRSRNSKNAIAFPIAIGILKEAKAAPVQVRSLPAVEAKLAIWKEFYED